MNGSILKYCELPQDLLELWKSFCRAQPIYHSPFYWPQFTQAVAKYRSDVRIAVFNGESNVVGFLPFHLTSGTIAKPIGGQLNDYQGPILAPGTTISPELLLKTIGASSYDYNHVPLSFSRLTQNAHSTFISPRMDLSKGYEAFAAKKGSKWTKAKREIRRRQRKTESEIGPIRFEYNNLDQDTFQQHIETKNALYERAKTRFRIKDDWLGKVIHFLRHFDDPEFSGVMTTIHAGDRLMASHFGIRTASVWHWWFPAYDLAAYKLGPGINLVDQCAMAAPEHGISWVDFGRGDGAFKLLFADHHIELGEGAITRPGSVASIVRNGTRSLVSLAEQLPLGRFVTYPRRAAAKFLTGVTLPDLPNSVHEKSLP